jgi:hypothetical protein
MGIAAMFALGDFQHDQYKMRIPVRVGTAIGKALFSICAG